MTNTKIKPVYIFSAVIGALFVVRFALLVHNPQGAQWAGLGSGGTDLFADFFNTIRHIMDRDPYFAGADSRWHVYLPFVYMLLYPLTKLDDFHGKPDFLEYCRASPLGCYMLVLYFVLAMLVFAHSLVCLCKRYKTNKIVLIPILLSHIVLAAIERGNLFFFTAAFLCYFLAFYDSENKYLRCFALISILLASLMKIYPMLFGIFYFQKRQFKEIFVAAILGIAMTFLPFLFFKHGFANIPQFISNLKEFSNNIGMYNLKFLTYRTFRFITHNETLAWKFGDISRHFTVIVTLLALVLAVFDKNYFRKILLVTLAALYLPPASFRYCGLYIMPSVVFFFSDEAKCSAQKSILLFIWYVIMFMPVLFLCSFTNRAGNVETLLVNNYLMNLSSFIVLIVCAYFSAREFLLERKR